MRIIIHFLFSAERLTQVFEKKKAGGWRNPVLFNVKNVLCGKYGALLETIIITEIDWHELVSTFTIIRSLLRNSSHYVSHGLFPFVL